MKGHGNLKNIFLINNQHSLKSYQLGNIEKFSKEVFFLTNNFFFQEQKKIFQGTTFVQFFMYCKAKKISERSKKFFFENLLKNFRKKNFKKFSDRSEIFFFALQYI